MIGYIDSLKFDIKYNYRRLQHSVSVFFSVQKYNILSFENGYFAFNKPVKSYKLLHVTAISLEMLQVQTILKILTKRLIFYDLYSQSTIQCNDIIISALFISISSVF